MPNIIVPTQLEESYKTGSLPESLTETDIERLLGFAPHVVAHDRGKVTVSWDFAVNGNQCGIWDYKGTRWSTYDPANVLPALFEPILRTKMLESLTELEEMMDAILLGKE